MHLAIQPSRQKELTVKSYLILQTLCWTGSQSERRDVITDLSHVTSEIFVFG